MEAARPHERRALLPLLGSILVVCAVVFLDAHLHDQVCVPMMRLIINLCMTFFVLRRTNGIELNRIDDRSLTGHAAGGRRARALGE